VGFIVYLFAACLKNCHDGYHLKLDQ
jgi:hypothetical protein